MVRGCWKFGDLNYLVAPRPLSVAFMIQAPVHRSQEGVKRSELERAKCAPARSMNAFLVLSNYIHVNLVESEIVKSAKDYLVS